MKPSSAPTKERVAKKRSARRRKKGEQPPNQNPKRGAKNPVPPAHRSDASKPITLIPPSASTELQVDAMDAEALPQLTPPEEIAMRHPGLDLCGACRELRPLEEFMEVMLDASGEPGPPPACRTCRERGLPRRMPVPQIHPVHLKILAMHASGIAHKAIARTVGVHPATVTSIITGTRGAVAREAFLMLLEAHGLDDRTVVLGILRGLYATKMQYSKATDKFEEFADEGVRLKATSLLAKFRQLEPPNAANEKSSPRSITIHSSLFDAEETRSAAGESDMSYERKAKGVQVEVKIDE